MKISRLSWLIFALNVAALLILTWKIDPGTPTGVARIVASVVAAAAAMLTLVNGARTGRRIAALETGRYPRLRPGAADRIASRLLGETAQTVTIAGEGGDDIREVAAALHASLAIARWHVREMQLGGTLWDSGRGIMVYHSVAASAAATALVDALQAEGLPAVDAGDCTTGLPVHIAFRRP